MTTAEGYRSEKFSRVASALSNVSERLMRTPVGFVGVVPRGPAACVAVVGFGRRAMRSATPRCWNARKGVGERSAFLLGIRAALAGRPECHGSRDSCGD